PDSLVHRVSPGQSLDVSTEAYPGARFAGRVTAIAPLADSQSRVFNIEVTIPNADGRLKPGMIGTVAVPTEASRQASAGEGADKAKTELAAVPVSAVVRSAEGANG